MSAEKFTSNNETQLNSSKELPLESYFDKLSLPQQQILTKIFQNAFKITEMYDQENKNINASALHRVSVSRSERDATQQYMKEAGELPKKINSILYSSPYIDKGILDLLFYDESVANKLKVLSKEMEAFLYRYSPSSL